MLMDLLSRAVEKLAATHPVVLILVLFLIGAGGSLWAYQPFVARSEFLAYAKQTDLDRVAIKESIDCLSSDFKRSSLNAQIRNASSELWSLEPLKDSGTATPRDIGRINNLRSDIREMSQELLFIKKCKEDS